jgi:hypothetical protein
MLARAARSCAERGRPHAGRALQAAGDGRSAHVLRRVARVCVVVSACRRQHSHTATQLGRFAHHACVKLSHAHHTHTHTPCHAHRCAAARTPQAPWACLSAVSPT